MPQYIYCDPEDENKIVEIVQSIHDKHVYIDEKGREWKRVYTIPNMAICQKIDPYSVRQFVDKTGAMKGTLGDCQDLAAELRDKRGGVEGDPIAQKHYKKYSKTRHGKLHPDVRKKQRENTLKDIERKHGIIVKDN